VCLAEGGLRCLRPGGTLELRPDWFSWGTFGVLLVSSILPVGVRHCEANCGARTCTHSLHSYLTLLSHGASVLSAGWPRADVATHTCPHPLRSYLSLSNLPACITLVLDARSHGASVLSAVLLRIIHGVAGQARHAHRAGEDEDGGGCSAVGKERSNGSRGGISSCAGQWQRGWSPLGRHNFDDDAADDLQSMSLSFTRC
jgi:hypothetical protein